MLELSCFKRMCMSGSGTCDILQLGVTQDCAPYLTCCMVKFASCSPLMLCFAGREVGELNHVNLSGQLLMLLFILLEMDVNC